MIITELNKLISVILAIAIVLILVTFVSIGIEAINYRQSAKESTFPISNIDPNIGIAASNCYGMLIQGFPNNPDNIYNWNNCNQYADVRIEFADANIPPREFTWAEFYERLKK